MPFAVGDNKLVASTPSKRPREPKENREIPKETTKDPTKYSGKDSIPAVRNTPPATLPPPAAPSRRGPSTPRREKPPQEGPAPLLAADAVAAALTRTLAPHLPATTGAAPELRPWSAADRTAARATFEDLATEHLRPVRNLMLELEWGVAGGAWLVAARGALSSLRPMADQIEATDISDAIGGFLAVLDQALVAGTIAPELGRQLVAACGPLARALPRAFDLRAERDRREPLLVQSLLGQVPGLEPLLLQRLFAVGLGRLDSLFRATAEEIAVVADLPAGVASALVEKARELRTGVPPGVEPTITDAARALGPLLATLKRQHHDYTRAAEGWSADDLLAKRPHRHHREQTFLRIKLAVTRLGDVDLALRLETYSYARRIDELEAYLQQAGGLAQAS
jgi:hypothetical protein